MNSIIADNQAQLDYYITRAIDLGVSPLDEFVAHMSNPFLSIEERLEFSRKFIAKLEERQG